MSKQDKRSPAMHLIHHIMAHQGEVWGGRSNTRWDDAMGTALSAAVRLGLRFDPLDLVHLALPSHKRYSTDKKAHPDGMRHQVTEGFYSMACGVRSESVHRGAAIAYENLVERTPFIWKDEHHIAGVRLAVGSDRLDLVGVAKTGKHKGEPVYLHRGLELTSFAEDGESFTACSYRINHDGHERKIDKRVKITREMLAVHNGFIKRKINGLPKYVERRAAKLYEAELEKDRKANAAANRGHYTNMPSWHQLGEDARRPFMERAAANAS